MAIVTPLAEYDYLDFGNKTVAINGTILPGIVNFPASFGMENAQQIYLFKAGLNWRILQISGENHLTLGAFPRRIGPVGHLDRSRSRHNGWLFRHNCWLR
jgi:hypothetical protein